MSSPNWLQAQHYHQQQPPKNPHYPSIYRSATPPPRPRSAAANSPQRGRQVIPRSLSVLHSRPPTPPPHPPRNATPSPAPPPPPLYVGGGNRNVEASLDQEASGAALQVDYNAIQRIADGVERMVRSWSSENSCRAQVYAKAYESLHAAAARGKDQQVATAAAQQQSLSFVHESTTTETNNSPFNPSAYNAQTDLLSAQHLAMRTLQSQAEPNSVDNAHGLLKLQPRMGDNDGEQSSSQENHGGPVTYAGHATYHDGNWSMGALCGPSRLPGLTTHGNQQITGNGEALYSTNNNMQCVHSHAHPYPPGLGLVNELDDAEQRNAGCMSKMGPFSNEREYDQALHLQQRVPAFQSVNTPVLRDDLITSSSSSSLVKHALRSRSPSLRLVGALSNNASHALDIYHNSDKNESRLDDKYQAKVKELEISLLECATEYEVQIVEMKMKMLQMKSEFRQKAILDDTRNGQAKLMLPAPTQDLPANVGGQSSSRYNRQLGNAASLEVSPDQSLESPKLKGRVLKERTNDNNIPSPKQKPRFFLIKNASVVLYI